MEVSLHNVAKPFVNVVVVELIVSGLSEIRKRVPTADCEPVKPTGAGVAGGFGKLTIVLGV